MFPQTRLQPFRQVLPVTITQNTLKDSLRRHRRRRRRHRHPFQILVSHPQLSQPLSANPQ